MNDLSPAVPFWEALSPVGHALRQADLLQMNKHKQLELNCDLQLESDQQKEQRKMFLS